MQVKSVSIQEWWKLMEIFPDHSFFQLPIWALAHEESYPGRRVATKLFSFDDGTKVLLPNVEMRRKFSFTSYESLPEGGYGGFLWNKRPDEDQMNAIVNSLIGPKILHLAIFPNPVYWEDLRFLERRGFVGGDAFTHILNLDRNFDCIWENRFINKSRNQVRKAIKSGVTVEPVDDISGVKAYYDLYLDSASRWGLSDKTVKPIRFFEKLFELGGNNVRYYLASYEGRYIAGVIIVYGGRDCFYWSGAMIKEFGNYCPNNLLLKQVIEDACESGYSSFNMGSSMGLPGVQKFKESFGAEKVNYKYYIYESPLLKAYRNITHLRL